LEKDGLTWGTRKLAADLVEIDVQDAYDTLIGLWDADALEKKTGMPIDDFCRLYLARQGVFEKVVEGSGVSLDKYYEKLGVRGTPGAAQWTDDLGRRRGPAARRWAGVALELALVAEGLSNREIAERLVVSPCTAKTHVSRAMVKLGARDRAQLVAFAYESGLARPGWLD